MKLNNEKLTKENLYIFLMDFGNRGLIINLLCLIAMVLIFAFVPNMWLKLLLYYAFWFAVVKTYDKVVDFIFNKIL